MSLYLLDRTLHSVDSEAGQANDRFGPLHSTHEGYGVLAEEVAELLDAIRDNDRDQIVREAIQVAAVALRLAEVADSGDARFDFRSTIKGTPK